MLGAWLLVLGSALQDGGAPAQADRTLELRNGRWFDGRGFEERTVFVVAGRFAAEPPGSADEVLDLAGGWVVPPFAEAHNHNLHDGADAALAKYLEQGVLYVANPNSLARSTTSIRARVNQPGTIDAVFAGGGLTSSGGHPEDVVRPLVERGIWTKADGDGGFYFAIDDARDLEATWPAIRAQPRDFLKTYLLYSEEFAALRDDDAARGWRGLDPALLPEIVRRAHEAGWRVSTHIESATDFHHAVAAGVDEVAHMPGFRPLVAAAAAFEARPPREFALSTYRIAAEDARRAAAQGTVVVTTLCGLLGALERVPLDAPERPAADEVVELVLANLALLQDHGVRIALGSDEYDVEEGTVVDEFLALARLGAFEPAALLRIWCEDTPRSIFPARSIGRFEPGFEASFLVLGDDPLADPENVRAVRLRVKQGRVLQVGR